MKNVRRRIHALERLPQFQPPPNPLEQANRPTQQQSSCENLELLMGEARDQEAGSYRTLTHTESAAVTAFTVAPDLQCQARQAR
jgi:hypothetical protein